MSSPSLASLNPHAWRSMCGWTGKGNRQTTWQRAPRAAQTGEPRSLPHGVGVARPSRGLSAWVAPALATSHLNQANATTPAAPYVQRRASLAFPNLQ